jgi:hypothetical protein
MNVHDPEAIFASWITSQRDAPHDLCVVSIERAHRQASLF